MERRKFLKGALAVAGAVVAAPLMSLAPLAKLVGRDLVTGRRVGDLSLTWTGGLNIGDHVWVRGKFLVEKEDGAMFQVTHTEGDHATIVEVEDGKFV